GGYKMNEVLQVAEKILTITTSICMIGIAISLILLIYRVMVGPTNPDRATALDVIRVCLMSISALIAIILVTMKLNDVILLIAILFFIGTLALAIYIETGVIIDRNDD